VDAYVDAACRRLDGQPCRWQRATFGLFACRWPGPHRLLQVPALATPPSPATAVPRYAYSLRLYTSWPAVGWPRTPYDNWRRGTADSCDVLPVHTWADHHSPLPSCMVAHRDGRTYRPHCRRALSPHQPPPCPHPPPVLHSRSLWIPLQLPAHTARHTYLPTPDGTRVKLGGHRSRSLLDGRLVSYTPIAASDQLLPPILSYFYLMVLAWTRAGWRT